MGQCKNERVKLLARISGKEELAFLIYRPRKANQMHIWIITDRHIFGNLLSPFCSVEKETGKAGFQVVKMSGFHGIMRNAKHFQFTTATVQFLSFSTAKELNQHLSQKWSKFDKFPRGISFDKRPPFKLMFG